MSSFMISIDGTPPTKVANKFWVEIARYDVNFLLLDGTCYIYGDATDNVIDIIYEKAKKFGFPMEIERG